MKKKIYYYFNNILLSTKLIHYRILYQVFYALCTDCDLIIFGVGKMGKIILR